MRDVLHEMGIYAWGFLLLLIMAGIAGLIGSVLWCMVMDVVEIVKERKRQRGVRILERMVDKAYALFEERRRGPYDPGRQE